MPAKALLRRILLIVILAGGVFLVVSFFGFISENLTKNGLAMIVGNAAVFPEQKESDFSLVGKPIRLRIPIIGVDAAIDYVGLAVDGAMAVPENQGEVAWFELGPRPGENGSAVMAGHYGLKGGQASVFDDLYKLRQGDRLYVENEEGVIISFIVRESRRYDPKADASEVFVSDDGQAHLNLITCEGIWNKDLKTYSERLVVFTDKD